MHIRENRDIKNWDIISKILNIFGGKPVISEFNGATLLITGGTGSFGSTVLKHFLESDIGQIRIFSRDEKKQDDMRHELQALHPDHAKKVKFYIGDVRDPRSVADAMPGVDYIFHSSLQASLAGRFGKSEYGLSKRAGEDLFFAYGEETGAPVYVYRFPNLVGKWVRPNYNSAVGTFCNNIANDLSITVNDPSVELEMLFVEDLIEEMYDAMEGRPHRCEYPAAGENGFDGLTPLPCRLGKFCYAPVTHKATLGRIVELLHAFHDQPQNLIMPAIPDGSFEKKLYSMYLSYLPKEKVAFDLKMNCDDRGSFTELLKTADHGQFSVNISKPGITKGQHWHNSKWEFFIVVAGHGLIQERKIGSDEVLEFEVSGEKIRAVHMLPGYTHNIINLSETENLVTVMWANEIFDPNKPDTFFEKV